MRFRNKYFFSSILTIVVLNTNGIAQSQIPRTKWYTTEDFELRGKVLSMESNFLSLERDSIGMFYENAPNYNGLHMYYEFSSQGWVMVCNENIYDSLDNIHIWSHATYKRDQNGNVVEWKDTYPEFPGNNSIVKYKLDRSGLLLSENYKSDHGDGVFLNKSEYTIKDGHYSSCKKSEQGNWTNFTEFNYSSNTYEIKNFVTVRYLKKKDWQKEYTHLKDSDSLVFTSRSMEEYDLNNQLIRINFYRGNSDTLVWYKMYERRSDGKMLSEKNYTISKTDYKTPLPDRGTIYQYNPEGFVIKMIELSQDPLSHTWIETDFTTFSYEFDDHGNWISKTHSDNKGAVYMLEKRKIEYQ